MSTLEARLTAALEAVRNIPPLTAEESGDDLLTVGWNTAMGEVHNRINEALEQS